MPIAEEAARFKSWAAEQGILTYQPPEDDLVGQGDDLNDLAETNQAAAAESIFNARKINLVLVSPENNEIIVCTHQKLTKKELETLPETSEEGATFRYVKAHPPQIRIPASGGPAAGNFTLHNNFYTCGSSISIGNVVSAGTLGCLVQNAAGEIFGLTNNHVTGGCGYSEVHVPIVAPGLVDVRPGGHDPFTLGHHAQVAPWTTGIPDNIDATGNIDAAIFRVSNPALISSMQRAAYDTPTEIAPPQTGISVRKVGRTTGLTSGTILGQSVGFEPVAMQVPQFNGLVYFHEVLVAQGNLGQPFADRGDSGSLVVTTGNDGVTRAVGLVYAVSADKALTFIIPIQRILNAFNVTLLGGHNA
ncbi:hypothetical protein [Sphingopyxis sp. 2PD]|uniref:hypothetical protein n=1 Tax=Sphingopyxis sp. 2PD TaxID=2502196 RepID=UPI0010FA5831|nr:hypothetical protein [Sphingopyxis sp. 2PD]